ncbi:hypothetical protein FKP32DRAFT_1555351, partial [Trametes sanguinea]
MRIDGTTCAETHIDDESGAIMLRRLHPRIASYNDLTIFLLKSNMDIKFIGSGEAAKALLYYVTDYITKPSLPTHIGLAALSYAIQKTSDRFPGTSDNSDCIDSYRRNRSAINTTVNRMMSQQEVSHQQVMSYLVGGGDVYTSHTFKILHWGSFDRLFHQDADIDEADLNTSKVMSGTPEETFMLTIRPDSVSATSQQQDYIYRSTEPAFDRMCLYEFVGKVEKITIQGRHDVRRDNGAEMLDVTERQAADGTASQNDTVHSGRGRTREPRGRFSSDLHTQFRTHMLRRRVKWIVPVILGERIPRSDRDMAEHEMWARMMSILFVPWRSVTDLRQQDESWNAAFERHRASISEKHLEVIGNMNVLSECRDARDAHREMRRAEALAFIQEGLPQGSEQARSDQNNDDIEQEFELFEQSEISDVYEGINDQYVSQSALDATIGTGSREALDSCYSIRGDNQSADARVLLTGRQAVTVPSVHTRDEAQLQVHAAIMQSLRKDRRPRPVDDDPLIERPKKRRRLGEVEERVSRARLANVQMSQATDNTVPSDPIGIAVEKVVEEMSLHANAEQERAFRIVADHVRDGDDQLLAYIAGVGGTGKTHVIKAILRFFELLGR